MIIIVQLNNQVGNLTVQGKGAIVDNNIFVFPEGEDLTKDDIKSFINTNDMLAISKYNPAKQMYLGKHKILYQGKRDHGPDNRLVANLAHYIVDTYNGFYIGIPPKITLDNDQDNEALQQWNNENSLQDKLSEISKQSAIYGRAIAFLYQDEDSRTSVAYSSPINSFIIYDDTVNRNPLAFVTYWHTEEHKQFGHVYLADGVYDLEMNREEANPYGMVPAVEFFMNSERQGIFENVETLINALDNVLSQKANQNEYFDNAYLKILGVDLDHDGDGKPDIELNGNQVIYSGDEGAANANVGFLEKPDGDNMQEHLIDRLISLIYQISMVANLNDEAFAGNSSGVALQYKLLPMTNLAANQDRKFTQSLRKLYKIAFSVGTILTTSKADSWRDLKFQFSRNMPVNLADEAETAQKLNGIVSKETQLASLSVVDDPKKEIKRMQDEQADEAKSAAENSPSNPDFLKSLMDGDSDDDEQ